MSSRRRKIIKANKGKKSGKVKQNGKKGLRKAQEE
jgi:hypothetical protein